MQHISESDVKKYQFNEQTLDKTNIKPNPPLLLNIAFLILIRLSHTDMQLIHVPLELIHSSRHSFRKAIVPLIDLVGHWNLVV